MFFILVTTLQRNGLLRLTVAFFSDTNVSGHMLYNVFTDFITSNHTTDEKVRLKIEHNQ
jgi:hypothetical protein